MYLEGFSKFKLRVQCKNLTIFTNLQNNWTVLTTSKSLFHRRDSAATSPSYLCCG